MSAFGHFAGSLFGHWFVYMTAGPFLLDEVVFRAFPKWRQKLGEKFPPQRRRRIEVTLIFVGLIWASFAAFKDEYDARRSAEIALQTAITKPPTPIPITETDPQARADIAALQKENERLKTQLQEEIQKSNRWGPTDEQFDVLSSNLKTAAAVEPIPSDEQDAFIACVMGDAGSMRFAEKLSSAFKQAGWKFKGDEGYRQSIFDRVPEGVIVHVHSKEDVPRALLTFIGTLKYFGIEVKGSIREQIQPGHFNIVIGLKPEQSKQPLPTPSTEASPH